MKNDDRSDEEKEEALRNVWEKNQRLATARLADLAEVSYGFAKKRRCEWEKRPPLMREGADGRLRPATLPVVLTAARAEAVLFGERLRRIRKQAGVSANDLAAQSGIQKRRLNSLERGQPRVWWDEVLRLASVLGVTPDAFGVPPPEQRHAEK